MNDAVKYSICRACEQTRLIDLLKKEPNRTLTARRMIMTELLKEEVSCAYLRRI